MLNTTQKSNFRFDIPDNRLSATFQWQIQSINFPSVQVEPARVVKSPKLSNTMIAGSATAYEDIQITFLIDENLSAYAELYEWMLTIQNPMGPTTESQTNVPRTALLYIMDNTRENVVVTFKFYEMYPKILSDLEWNYTETGDVEALTCVATFGYTHFDMILASGKVISPRPYDFV